MQHSVLSPFCRRVGDEFLKNFYLGDIFALRGASKIQFEEAFTWRMGSAISTFGFCDSAVFWVLNHNKSSLVSKKQIKIAALNNT